MEKCHSNCVISLDEAKLLKHEEACFRNCFVKSAQFNKHFSNEIKYSVRQFAKPAPEIDFSWSSKDKNQKCKEILQTTESIGKHNLDTYVYLDDSVNIPLIFKP